MKNNRMLPLFGLGAVALAYYVILFAVVRLFTFAFWIGLGFTTLAFALVFFVLVMNIGGKHETAVLRLPIITAAFIYLVVQLAVGTVIMWVPFFSPTMAVVAEVVVLVAFVLYSFAGIGVRNLAEANREEVKSKTMYNAALLAEVQSFQDIAKDEQLNSRIARLAERVRYSDPMTHESLVVLEQDIDRKMASLGKLVRAGETETAMEVADELEAMLADRARQCKMLK